MNHRNHVAAAFLVVAFVSHGGRPSMAGDSAVISPSRPSLVMQPGREFAADSYVHRLLPPDTEKDPRSDIWVRSLLAQIRDHYGTVAVNTEGHTPPLFIAGPDTPTVRVRAERADMPGWSFPPLQAQWLDVPLPEGFRASAGTDKEAILYQPSTGRYWEFWGLEKSGRTITDSSGRSVPEWRAAWGGRIDNLASNGGYFPTTPAGHKFGTAATGLALLAGLITIAEQRRGEVNHALHIALPRARKGRWAWPAQRTDGAEDDPLAIPQGVTFRLPASLDLDRIAMDPYARMLARAAQRHGIVVRDTAGAVVLYAENPLASGADDPYHNLGGIFRCPEGKAVEACWSYSRLRGFPWDRLEAIKASLTPAER